MKRIALIAMCFVMLITLCSCKPSDVGELSYEMGKDAIEVVDDYLDYTINASAAYDRLKEVQEQENVISYEYGSPTYDKDMSIRIKLNGLIVDLIDVQVSNTDENRQVILDERNDLAELLGISTRN
ncbi:MAG: hypothetical protein LUH03_07730 [Oscillospiraceae bacterium]|nr:hypothetical protein [Oscillospiraceae bacterium]